MILSYAKPFNEKMCEQLVKIRKKKKNMWAIFQHFPSMIDKEKTQTQISFFGIKILSNSQNTTIFTQNA